MKRHVFTKAALILSTHLPTVPAIAATFPSWRMPDEADPHTSTWIDFGANDAKVDQLNVDGIAAGGGSIHCTTQQEILV